MTDSSVDVAALKAIDVSYVVTAQSAVADGVRYVGYGIGVVQAGALLSEIADVVCNYSEACRLVALLNRAGLSPCQLQNVVEDYLNG